jgi:hypothetical protein
MPNRIDRLLVLSLACAAATAVVPLPAEAAPPGGPPPSGPPPSAPPPPGPSPWPHVLDAAQTAAVQGLPYLTPAQLRLQGGAVVAVSVPKKGTPQQAVRRAAAADAAAYVSLPASNEPLLPAVVEVFDFKVVGDAAQAWATMTVDGVPHVKVSGSGEFRADATAAWSANYTLGGTTAKELVLRFVLPAASIDNNTEAQGPAWWRSRLRAEVLVNGHPAWSTEALLMRADYQNNGLHPLALLQQFGDPLAFDTDDEDAMAGNDTDASAADTQAARREVYLSLGRFNPGAAVNLQFIVRGTALTVPTSPGGTDNRCTVDDPTGELFCSEANVSVLDGSAADAPRLYLAP